ncbi:MAG: argininosuccinate lyase [Armatimonadota bacterium]|nr:argininosuccinate lyase [Armatimonadota bacterium]MDR7533323.1 argininosuccinate lyase [Armatimonadota bacterium]MDR7536558.1 argininosuccinate lyase [Armatimonadota bacterium]
MSESAEPAGTYRMWGGRFRATPEPRVLELLSSLPVDRWLLRWDLLGSLAHVVSLGEAGVIPPAVRDALAGGLRALLAEADASSLVPAGAYEDVHSFIEGTLAARLGEVAGWLHTGRSRNDQVATAFRLALKDEVRQVLGGLCGLLEALLHRAREAQDVIVPGYTHLQRAQPVLLAHAWLAYFWMLRRDAGRLRDAYRRLDVLPLGSGAIAGSGFPVDRQRQAALLGFAEISQNSIDATGDRDFAFELLAAAAALGLHLSRWAEDLVLWASHEFGLIGLPQALLTGSSLMPQKQNPDLLEMARGQAGVALGALVTLGVVLKGLPAGYSRDLQEDKAATATGLRAVRAALEAMTLVVAGLEIRRDRAAAALRGGFLTATEVADYLVRRGVPFREAHHLAGQVVLAAEERGCELWELPLAVYRQVSPRFGPDVLQAVTVEGAVAAKATPGGTAPEQVAAALEAAQAALVVERAWVDQAAAAQQQAEARLLAAAGG